MWLKPGKYAPDAAAENLFDLSYPFFLKSTLTLTKEKSYQKDQAHPQLLCNWVHRNG